MFSPKKIKREICEEWEKDILEPSIAMVRFKSAVITHSPYMETSLFSES